MILFLFLVIEGIECGRDGTNHTKVQSEGYLHHITVSVYCSYLQEVPVIPTSLRRPHISSFRRVIIFIFVNKTSVPVI